MVGASLCQAHQMFNLQVVIKLGPFFIGQALGSFTVNEIGDARATVTQAVQSSSISPRTLDRGEVSHRGNQLAGANRFGNVHLVSSCQRELTVFGARIRG